MFYLVAKQRSIVILVFLSAFCPRGGGEQNEMCELLRGGASMYMYLCAKHVAKLGGPGVCSPGKFLFWTFYYTQFGGIWDCFHINVIYHLLCH